MEAIQKRVVDSAARSVSEFRKFFGLGVSDSDPYLAVLVKGYPKPYLMKIAKDADSDDVALFLNSIARVIDGSKELNSIIEDIYREYSERGFGDMLDLKGNIIRFQKDCIFYLSAVAGRLRRYPEYSELVERIDGKLNVFPELSDINSEEVDSLAALINWAEEESGRKCISEFEKLRRVFRDAERDIDSWVNLQSINKHLGIRERMEDMERVVDQIEGSFGESRFGIFGKPIRSLFSPALAACSSIVTISDFQAIVSRLVGFG